jgi:hypothetical protein
VKRKKAKTVVRWCYAPRGWSVMGDATMCLTATKSSAEARWGSADPSLDWKLYCVTFREVAPRKKRKA